ncbi:hypothetical protein [Daejeonella sp.]
MRYASNLNGILQNSGPFGSMCSHRVQLSSLEEVNTGLLLWLKETYDNAE